MVSRLSISVVASLLIAAAISVAAVTPIEHRPYLQATALGICYLDWPISKLSDGVHETWQGLGLFTESSNCRGVSPNMPRIFAFQGVWSALVYTPIFLGLGTVVHRIRRRKTAR